jgi:hypothetical protein
MVNMMLIPNSGDGLESVLGKEGFPKDSQVAEDRHGDRVR